MEDWLESNQFQHYPAGAWAAIYGSTIAFPRTSWLE